MGKRFDPRRMLGLLVLLAGLCTLVSAADVAADSGRLELFTVTVDDRRELGQLVAEGYDAIATRATDGGFEADIVLSPRERAVLVQNGRDVRLWRDADGLTLTQVAEKQQPPYTVWRSFDDPGGLKDEMYELAMQHPELVKLEVIGTSVLDRPIIALKVTKNAPDEPDGTRPSVLYISLQHAREWIGAEVSRRLLHHLLERYGQDPQVTELVDTRELWFVLVANPDGYEYTFDTERLWRKNLRDNNNDGQITNADGVDPNRNFANHWNYDNEGSSGAPGSQTYRGPGPASEPETRAMESFLHRMHFTFLVNYHSVAELVLYGLGWQVKTFSADTPVFAALSGDDANPAIPGFDPGVSADLYITNGETCDHAYSEENTPCWTVELSDANSGGGFVFPDDESLVQGEFENNLPFALDVAISAATPDNPVSHLGNTVHPFYVTPFAVSYGDPQTVQVNAKRSLGEVTLKYQVNAGPEQSAPTVEWAGGRRYGDVGAVFYRFMRGQVSGAKPGDEVTVWFEASGQQSDRFTYRLESDRHSRLLVLAAEDYTGSAPNYAKTDGPSYLQPYLDALHELAIDPDVYDVDAHGRQAPSPLGVLGHYDAVIWYTGDDVATREPGMAEGTVSRLAQDIQIAVRDYLNEGGRVFYTGKYAGYQYTQGYEFDPLANMPCDPNRANDGCEPLSNDFLQYYLGADTFMQRVGLSSDLTLYPVAGTGEPFVGLSWTFAPLATAGETLGTAFLPTSSVLPADTYPQFTSWNSTRFDRPGDRPHSGEHDLYSRLGSYAYKRVMREIDLAQATTASLSFWISRDTQPNRGYVFVEAHGVGEDDWTTLPDQNGHTSTDAGDACRNQGNNARWLGRHPQLLHYLARDATTMPPTCLNTGTTGTWNAASGRSDGWEQWQIDLTPYAGKKIEVSISYVSGGTTIGVFVDDISLSTGEPTSFEMDLGGWTIAGPPPGSPANAADFLRATTADIPVGPVIVTDQVIFFGFGFESIATSAERLAVMRQVMDYLLPRPHVYLPSLWRAYERP